MKILCADYILTCDEKFTILKDAAICFDKKITDIGKQDEIIKKNPYALVKKMPKNTVLMPGLVNTHIHLEYSANRSTLFYGDFISWLKSVITHREILRKKCQKPCYDKAIEEMLHSGVTAFGAISSFGDDLLSCFKAHQKVVYFNEILGSNPNAFDEISKEFYKKFQNSCEYQNERFTPAISIHSPYSTHPKLMDFALNIAREENLIVSTHFMESRAEREWLDHGRGDFYDFLKIFSPDPKPMQSAKEFLEKFRNLETIFVHTGLCNEEELKFIKDNGTISHCIVSNRLLGNPSLDMKKISDMDIEMHIGTDGLSSNNSLNMWDELRAALFFHHHTDSIELSRNLIKFATIEAAKALKIKDKSAIEIGKVADIISIVLPEKVENLEQLPLMLILHAKEVHHCYIDGERYV